MPRPTRIVVPGTAPELRRRPMRQSRPSSSAPQAGRRRAVESPPRRRSWSAPSSSHPTPPGERRARWQQHRQRPRQAISMPRRACSTFADAGPLDDLSQARSQRLRAELAFDLRRGRDAPPLLLGAAQRLETLDAELACETYLEALVAALYAGRSRGRLRRRRYRPRGACHTLRHRSAGRPRSCLLVGLATRFTDGYAAAAPTLKKALGCIAAKPRKLEWSCLAFNVAAMDLWDDEAWFELVSAQARLARATGTLSFMAFALSYLAGHHTWPAISPRRPGCSPNAERLDLDTGSREKNVPYISLQLAAWRGEEPAALGFREVLTEGAEARGEGAASDRRRVCHRRPLQRARSVRPRERGGAQCSR